MNAPRVILLLSAVALLVSGCFLNPGAERIVQDQYDVDPGDELTVTTDVGSIEIESWNRDYMDVTARIRETSSFLGRTDIDTVEIVVDTSADITIWALPEDRNGVSVSFEIRTPAGVEVELARTETGSVRLTNVYCNGVVASTTGSVTLDGVDGYPEARTDTGSITATNGYGVRRAVTSTGSIDVEFSDLPAVSRVPIETNTGSITVRLDPSLDADIEADTGTGSVSVHASLASSSFLAPNGKSLHGTIGTGGPNIDARTSTGSITFRGP